MADMLPCFGNLKLQKLELLHTAISWNLSFCTEKKHTTHNDLVSHLPVETSMD